MKNLDLIISLSVIVALYAMFVIVYLILFVKENNKGKAITECLKKKKRKLPKTYYQDKYNQLLEDFIQLSKDQDNLRDKYQKVLALSQLVKDLKIDLEKLEEIGLHRYNAEYGKRLSDIRFGLRSTFISEFLYEELIRYGFINKWRDNNEKRNQN